MGADQHFDWEASVGSTLDWWRDAGVDVLVDDSPRDWLARTPTPRPAADVTAPPPVAAPLPDTLDAYVAWRLGPDAPEGGAAGAVLMEGDVTSNLMIVTDCPDDDGLIGGVAGRLFDRMLAAIGRSRESVQLVTLTTVRPIGGRIAPDAMPRLAELLHHHVALARPEHVLLLGQAPSRALIGMDVTRGERNLHAVNLDGGTVAAVSSLHPRFLVERPAMKAQAWKDLQLLLGDPR